jgi:hypothetical protein
MRLERKGAEPVDEEHDGVANGRQPEGAALTSHRLEAIRQHIGEAEPVRFGRR